SYTDNRPLLGTSYYRLKQTDFNGDFEYSDIISIHYKSNQPVSLTVYPNPTFSNHFYVRLNGAALNDAVGLKLVDIVGRTHLDLSYSAGDLLDGVQVTAEKDLAPGIYLVIVEQAGQIFKTRLIVN